MADSMPPEVIYYSETGGKTAPFYRTLGGIKSAFKTTWAARYGWRSVGPPKVYAGTVTWREIDPETGKPIGGPFPDPPRGVSA
jgi:hypothetical protein